MRRKKKRKLKKSVVLLTLSILLNCYLLGGIIPQTISNILFQEIELKEEDSLANNIEIISRIIPKKYENLTFNEKEDLIATVMRIEAHYLGMDCPKLSIEDIEEYGVIGQYSSTLDQVTIDKYYINDKNTTGYNLIHTVCHEMYHRYQHYQVNLLKEIRDDHTARKYKNLLFLADINIYEEEQKNYISSKEDKELYSNQLIEKTADQYADQAVVDYYDRIQKYYNSNE